MSKNEFNFSGLPGNEPIEVQSQKKNKINMPLSNSDGMEFLRDFRSGNLNFSKIKGMIPKELLEELESEAEASGITDLESFFNNEMKNIIGQIIGSISGDFEGDDEECTDQEDQKGYVYELSDIKYLGEQLLGDVPALAVGASKILTDFENMFGSNGSNFPNIIENVLTNSACMTEAGYNALIYFKDNFGGITVKEITDHFILLYITSKNSDEYGIYFTFSEDGDGNPCLSVPLFANTFNVDSDGNFKGLYNKTIETPFFNGDKFIPEQRAAIDLSVRSQLVCLKNILLSPAQFGTLKNIIPAITSDSRYLKIGKLVSNESTEAVLLKKDADLDLNETEFPFYLDFGRVITKESLQILSSILFKINLNETLLMHASELEFKGDMLYIKVDFGEYFN